jgi:cytochrome c biogenesis protein CcmG/thiol:disulfide interchange protein DsbE
MSRGHTLARLAVPALAAVAFLVAAGLVAVAVRSVFRTSATEVTPQVQAAGARTSVGPMSGALAPLFTVPALADARQTIRLAALRGHPVVLNFWASWCPPCRAEAGALEAASRQYDNRGVVFVGIDAQTDIWADSLRFVRQHGITYAVGRDVTGAVARAYRVPGLPTTYFIGADGRVQGPAVTGGFTGSDGAADLRSGIEKMLDAKGE